MQTLCIYYLQGVKLKLYCSIVVTLADKLGRWNYIKKIELVRGFDKALIRIRSLDISNEIIICNNRLGQYYIFNSNNVYLGFLADNNIASTGATSPERNVTGNRGCEQSTTEGAGRGWRVWRWVGPREGVGEILVNKKCKMYICALTI